MRGPFLRPQRGRAGLQQPGGLPHLRRHRRGPGGGPVHPGAGRLPDHRPGGGSPLEQPHVVTDDRRLPGDGGAHRRPLPGSDGRGEGYRLRRPRGEKAHPLPREELQRCGGAGLYVFQRRPHGGKRPVQGEGREGHEARGEIPEGGRVPGLRRLPPVRGGPRRPSSGASVWMRPAECPWQRWWTGWLRCPPPCPRRCARWRSSICESFQAVARRLMELGLGLSDPGPRRRHPLHRGAAADAAGPGGAQPHHRGCCTCWTSPPSGCTRPISRA